MLTKICSKCNKEKDFSDFYKSKSGKFGIMNYCKTCQKDYNDKWKKNNPVKYSKTPMDLTKKSLTGKIKNCTYCNTSFYQHKHRLKDKNFCSNECWNKYQSKDSYETYICKFCLNSFTRRKRKNTTYCSLKCQNKDTSFLSKRGIIGMASQLNKKGLNKLETKGSEILNDLGINHEVQVQLFEKFIVDVLIRDLKIIIQWDGEYWHSKPKRKNLDVSQDNYLSKCGYKIIRITDKEIKDNIKSVENKILNFYMKYKNKVQ